MDKFNLFTSVLCLQVSSEEAKTYDTVIFEGPPLMKQRLWPRHCVQDSWGAELHKELKVIRNCKTVKVVINYTEEYNYHM